MLVISKEAGRSKQRSWAIILVIVLENFLIEESMVNSDQKVKKLTGNNVLL